TNLVSSSVLRTLTWSAHQYCAHLHGQFISTVHTNLVSLSVPCTLTWSAHQYCTH
ncbi:predicted protein, partial [Nematostella vectensis]